MSLQEGETFQTDFDHTNNVSSSILVIPPSVNLVAVRESVMAEVLILCYLPRTCNKK